MVYIVLGLSLCIILISIFSLNSEKSYENLKKINETDIIDLEKSQNDDFLTKEQALELLKEDKLVKASGYIFKYKENIVINDVDFYLFLAYNSNNTKEIVSAITVNAVTGKVSMFNENEQTA